MFTGIIAAQGIIKSAPAEGLAGKVVIGLVESCSGFLAKTKLGDSIAVNGVCLTVIDFDSDQFTVEISPETVKCTSFDALLMGQLVNLEHSIKYGSSIDGHLVQGHVDTICTVREIKEASGNWQIILSVADLGMMKFIAKKGSVTLNGVSLTVNNVNNHLFMVNIIPHTLAVTNLSLLKAGDKLNLEVDMFARYCVNYLDRVNSMKV